MANSKRRDAKTKHSKKSDIVQDLSWFWSDFTFTTESMKDSKIWASQALFFMKLNSTVLVPQDRFIDYRKLSMLDINRQTYVDMVDPPTPMGGGGTAEYFAADFKANPINIHLDNIVRAKLDKLGVINKLQVNEIDKFAKTQRQTDKDKVIHQRLFRDLITMIAGELGLPPLSKTETAEEYVTKLQGKNPNKGTDNVSRIIDQIRMKVKDDKTYALYERYAYKGEIERAFEMWMEHDIINQNKWRIISEDLNDDLKNFNRAVLRVYTDETSGRQILEYIQPNTFFTNPFQAKNGEDIVHCFHEKDITFADFVRQFGTTLTNEELKEVFLMNKIASNTGTGHGQDWSENPSRSRDNARIRIGFASVLTQEAEKFSEEYVNDRIPSYKPIPDSWKPDKESANQKQRIYNVWYSFYYVPPPGERYTRNAQASWSWQSRFIFNMKKNLDMYRYGIDNRYAKSEYVVWKDPRPSFMDISQAFMPKIHTVWHKFQNCIIQDTTAVAIDVDLITGLLNAVDESNSKQTNNPQNPTGSNGIDAGMQAWRSIKQGGMGFVKFRDKNGNLLVQDPSKLFVGIDSGHLEKAERYLQVMLGLYEQMKMALAQNDVTEGQQAKPRTAVAAIEASLESSNNAIFFLEKPARELLIMVGERNVQWQLNLLKEKKVYNYTERWDEYCDVVGLANALLIESIEDENSESLGITVSLEDTTAMQEYIFALANEMAKNKEVSRDSVGLVIDTVKTNYKYAYALLMLAAEEQAEENAANEDVAHQRQMEMLQMQNQIALNLVQAKSGGIQQEIKVQGEVDAQLQQQINELKFQTQSMLKSQTTNSRMQETDNRLEKEHNLKNQDSLLVQQ